jgi:hypothetical protein
MFYWYLDDGGEIADSPFVVVAGYLASEAYWHRSNEMWRHMLLLHGVSVIYMNKLQKIRREKAG